MQKLAKPKKLLNKNFMILWQGQFVSLIGNSVFGIALMFWLKHQTNSASLMGLVMMASMIPSIILGPASVSVIIVVIFTFSRQYRDFLAFEAPKEKENNGEENKQ